MVENKRIVMVGIPGVGKTTLLSAVVQSVRDKNIEAKVVGFGTLMFEIAKEHGIEDRDDLRKLPVARQKEFQIMAANKIALMGDPVLIVDTHAFISSPEGYYPGLPHHVLEIIRPTNFISVAAKPEEIYSRRMGDATRKRDHVTLAQVKKDLEVQSGMISACAVITGSPVKHVMNSEGRVDLVANEIARKVLL